FSTTSLPWASSAWTWKTFFAISRPIVLTIMTDGLLAGNQHPQLGTSDAVGGRPPSIASREAAWRSRAAAPPPPLWIATPSLSLGLAMATFRPSCSRRMEAESLGDPAREQKPDAERRKEQRHDLQRGRELVRRGVERLVRTAQRLEALHRPCHRQPDDA